MAKGSFTITLADGSKIGGLGLNGNNFISGSPITPAMFDGKLSHVTIDGTDDTGMGDYFMLVGEHTHMELLQITQEGESEWWFVLRDIPKAELEKQKILSDIAYLSMMTGVDLD